MTLVPDSVSLPLLRPASKGQSGGTRKGQNGGTRKGQSGGKRNRCAPVSR